FACGLTGVVPPGKHTVTFCVNPDPPSCGESSSATFVVRQPQISLSLTHGRAGETRVINGRYFEPVVASHDIYPSVQLSFEKTSGFHQLTSFTEPNGQGSFGSPQGRFTIPSVAFGKHHVQACNASKGCIPGWSAQTVLTVTRPHILLGRTTGRLGD